MKTKNAKIFYLFWAVVCLVPILYKMVQGSFSLTFFSAFTILFGCFSLFAVIFFTVNKKKLEEMEKTKETGKSQFQRRLEEAAKKKQQFKS